MKTEPVPGTLLLIQPPFVQLNSPYPSLYYLRSFLAPQGYEVMIRDHSIGLFERIFCRAGLERIFADAEIALGENRQVHETARRFISEADRWVNHIDRLVDFLRGRDREWGHWLAIANGTLPGGPRFDVCLESLGGNPLPEDAPLLASKLLADMADFITQVLDPGFSLVRYTANVAAGAAGGLASFVQAGYVLRVFYEPYLEEEWARLTGDAGVPTVDRTAQRPAAHAPAAVLLSIPFPGCLTGALCCAASAKRRFGDTVPVIAGGGYVNTELRYLSDPALFDYFDYLSFDRGYGALDAILGRASADAADDAPLYKTMYRTAAGRIIADDRIATGRTDAVKGGDDGKAPHTGGGTARAALPSQGQAIDDRAAITVFPDYRGVDFSRYICPVDDLNPMHRLWTDGRWLKVYLAHGCYWQKCSFCDVTLDYICSYKKVDPKALYRHLLEQAEATGVRGVHLVDEAAPPASLTALALLNLGAPELQPPARPLSFWGNIRFEKAFSPDVTALLAAGGLVGVSGGIEIATEAGFKRIGKGITLESTVRCCAAFKEAGILVHAYLIYGYWDEDEQEIIDSAEILRQFFEAGLLDSAFWHRFVLTRHSKVYAETQGAGGAHQGLKVRPLPAAGLCFALNDLSFEGEERFAKYDGPLDSLLAAWMAGDTEVPVSGGGAFPFKVKRPGVPGDLIAKLLDAYARDRDDKRGGAPLASQGAVFLGSRPWDSRTAAPRGPCQLRWRWRLGEHALPVADRQTAEGLAALLAAHAPGAPGSAPFPAQDLYARLEELLGAAAGQGWRVLREGGLVLLPNHKM